MARQEIRQQSIGHCRNPACRGWWLPLGTVEGRGQALRLEPLDWHTLRRCATCRITLTVARLRSSLTVETCSACHGIFLEDAQLQGLAGTKGPRPASGQRALQRFTCVKCGKDFPFSEGNALATGLACRACTPNPRNGPEEWRPLGASGEEEIISDALMALNLLWL